MRFSGEGIKRIVLYTVLVIVAIGAVGGSGVLLYRYFHHKKPTNKTAASSQKDPGAESMAAAAASTALIQKKQNDITTSITNGTFKYDPATAPFIVDSMTTLIDIGKYDGVKAALDAIPDDATVTVLIEKYETYLRLFSVQQDQTNYTKYRAQFYAMLQSHQSDSTVADLYKNFDTLYSKVDTIPTKSEVGP